MTQGAVEAGASFDAPYRRWRIRIFAITWIAYAGLYFTRQSFSVAKLGILDDPILSVSLNSRVLGQLDALYLAAYAIGQFVWGQVADRYGPRVVLLGGLAISVVAALFMGVLPALVFLIPLMIVQGLAQSTGWASTLDNMAQFFSIGERGRVLGYWSTNYAFGGLVAAPFLGWVAYSVFDSWRVAFFAGAAVVLVVLLLVVVFQRNCPTDVGLPPIEVFHADEESSGTIAPLDHTPEADAIAEPTRSWWSTLVTTVREPMVRSLGAAYFLLKPARYAILLWGPVIVSERLPDASNLEATLIPVAFGVAGILAPILIGRISDKVFKARRVPATVLSLVILVAALALFVPLTATGSAVVMVVVLAVIGLAVYGADSMVSCVAAVDFGTSKHAGTAAGLVNGCGSVGAILGGLLPGYLGTSALFYGFAGAAFLAMIILIPHWNRMPAAD